MDYRATLNLPQTGFAMKANLAQKEPVLLSQWDKEDIYRQIREKSKGKKKFILHDGPPYANGNIHIGHALNKILKDMIVKFKTMQGFDSVYVPGWDCHGLPIEHQLFKELKTDKSKIDCVSFRKQAHDYAMKYVGIQKEQFKRLGVFGDWDNPYLTLTPEYEYWILKSLATLTQDGYVYRGLKPVNWCASCETALAEAEVEYEDHESHSVYVKFKVNNPEVIKGFPKGKELFLLVWTTTPWTLLANVAVAVHPAYKYYFVENNQDGGNNNEILIIESSRYKTYFLETKLAGDIIKTIAEDGEIEGSGLTKLNYAHPFGLRKNCPVVTADYVTREDGTGLVHTAPGHGMEDYQTGLKYKLDIVVPVDHRGIYTKEAGDYAGQHVFKANEKIIEDLRGKSLFANAKINHSYPHCWRCKKPIIFRATEQWFLKIDHKDLRKKLVDAIERDIVWVPPAGKERILGMVATRPDWCLSRQRYWGVPIPALICRGCGGKHQLYAPVIEHFAGIAKKEGSDAWFKRTVSELIPPGFACPDCHKNDFEKTNDILDVWFDSGVSHQAVLKGMLKEEPPAALYLEGSDQHRGWFQSSLIPSVAIDGRPPYRAVLTHGFVVDGQGRKMSKSLGNVVSPQDIMKTHGADILRLWVAASDYNDDIRISKEILDRLVDAYRKIRNTVRFLLSNLYDFDPDKNKVSSDKLLDIDCWALSRLTFTLDAVTKGYEAYDFARVYKAIYSFCNDDLSSIYLDILKDRLYTSASSSSERRAAQTVLYDCLDALVRMMAPILSFTAQEILTVMPRTAQDGDIKDVHLLGWPAYSGLEDAGDVENKLKILLDLRPFVLKSLEEKRQQGMIGSSLEAKVVIETASDRDFKALSPFDEDVLRAFFITSQAKIKKVPEVVNGISEDFSKTRIIVENADGQKCGRCWNYSPAVGKDRVHPVLCERCLDIVKEIGNAK
ncbi:MAG TPA: isoleucine--tRNA ligase [Candidatus Omnitrophota bacterium]|nr:isoleucine--tRNA ligase [Candidatus Omnitrophota bacterium]